jgi:phage terminase large subunit
MSDVLIPKVYKPFMELIEGRHPEVGVVICTGGRYSGKSHGVNLGLAHAVAQFGHRILHTRYTMVSASKSIIPDFKDKLDILGYNQFYTVNKNEINSNFDGGQVLFSGIKTGSNFQDSALKSLSNMSIFCTEEASEIPTFNEWEKIDLSIRSQDVQPFSVLILNPTDVSHWIFEEFFKKKNVRPGFNGIVDDVMYIHTTWEDLPEEFIVKKHLNKFKSAKKVYLRVLADLENGKEIEEKELKVFSWYKEIVLGGWKNSIDNLCVPHWQKFTDFPEKEPDYVLFGLDFGTSPDPNALVETRVYGDDVFIKEHLYKNDMLNSDLAEAVKESIGEDREGEIYVVADSANKQNIKELAKLGIYIIKCKKGSGSIEGGLQKLRSSNIFVHEESLNLIFELNHYHYTLVVNPKGERKIVPIDKDNHLMDAARYSLSIY